MPEPLVLQDDRVRDLARGFNPVFDVIDVSALGVTSFEELELGLIRRDNGVPNWIEVRDAGGEVELALRFVSGVSLDPALLTADQFIFADAPPPAVQVTDQAGFQRLDAAWIAEVFGLVNDDTLDLIRGFAPGLDKIDASA